MRPFQHGPLQPPSLIYPSENPFNYDLNDLDLDGFCLQTQRELAEITAVRRIPSLCPVSSLLDSLLAAAYRAVAGHVPIQRVEPTVCARGPADGRGHPKGSWTRVPRRGDGDGQPAADNDQQLARRRRADARTLHWLGCTVRDERGSDSAGWRRCLLETCIPLS